MLSHADGLLSLAKALSDDALCLTELGLSGLQLTSRLAEQGLRAPEVCAARAQRQLLRLSQTADALSNGGGGRLQIGLAGHGSHVLARGQCSETRVQVLTRRAKLAGGVRHSRTLRGQVQVAQALVDLANACGDVASGLSSLAHGPLSVGELVAGVSSAQDVSCFAGGVVRLTQRLVGSGHVRRERAYAQIRSRLHGGLLWSGKAGYLEIRQLLRQGLAPALIERQVLRFLQ